MSMSVSARRIPFLAATVILFLGIVIAVLPIDNAFASEITNRSLTLSSSNPAASNATTKYTFAFTVPSATVIQSVGIQICNSADISASCTAPTGFSNSSASLDSAQPTGLGAASGWTYDASPPSTNDLYISDSSNATAPSGNQTIIFDNVQNPTTANQTFYAWITTYSDAAWTTSIDSGVVAASTTQLIVLTGTMPESLTFCTGQTVNQYCTVTGSPNITFNHDFSPSTSSYATSQFAASTNASKGYAITVSGPPLSDGGSDHINGTDQVSNAAVSDTGTVGTSEFGMNVVADSNANGDTPAPSPASAAITPASDGTSYFGIAHTNFSTANSYAFTDTTFSAGYLNDIAGSDYSAGGPTGTAEGTDGQVYTSTYMVNVEARQAAGTYTTTLTYICTPEF